MLNESKFDLICHPHIRMTALFLLFRYHSVSYSIAKYR